MSFPATSRGYGAWRFDQLEGLVDEFLADPTGLDDIAELERAALVLRAPFEALGAPPAAAADLALVFARRGDELAAGMLAVLAVFSHQPLAREAANAVARLSGRGTVSPLARHIGTLKVVDTSSHQLPGSELIIAQLERPSELRAQVAMIAFDSYPCGTVISHLEVTPPQPVESARASLRARPRGSTPRQVETLELFEKLAAAAEHMEMHDVALDPEAAVWLPALERTLTGRAIALPRLAVAEPEPVDRTAAKSKSLDDASQDTRDGSRRSSNGQRQAKRRASRAARRRNRR
jgi:hypothetical protein